MKSQSGLPEPGTVTRSDPPMAAPPLGSLAPTGNDAASDAPAVAAADERDHAVHPRASTAGAEPAEGQVAQKLPAPPGPPRLTVSCVGDREVTSAEVAPISGGQRIVVTYVSGEVIGESNGKDLKGFVLNGGDWIFVRDDGVVLFDAHFTIGKSLLDADLLQDVAATLRRELLRVWPQDDYLADLFLVGQAPLPVQDWHGGDIDVPFSIPVRVEAATKAPPWAKARFGDLAEGAERFVPFTGHQCTAEGTLEIRAGRVTAIEFDVKLVQPPNRPIVRGRP
jgi:hypothetical protein